jgi:hypothetical protein
LWQSGVITDFFDFFYALCALTAIFSVGRATRFGAARRR